MRWGEKPGYIEALRQGTGSLNVLRLLLTKENQITQIKEFSAFLHKGRCKNLGWGAHETIPLMCISAIWGQYLVFFTFWASLGLTEGNGYSLMAARWQVFLFLPVFSQGSPAHIGVLQLLMTVTSLFTDMIGNIPFLRRDPQTLLDSDLSL